MSNTVSISRVNFKVDMQEVSRKFEYVVYNYNNIQCHIHDRTVLTLVISNIIIVIISITFTISITIAIAIHMSQTIAISMRINIIIVITISIMPVTTYTNCSV
jgi:hypothetical protein